MDVPHDTIKSTQGPVLIEVAYFSSSEGKGQGFYISKTVGLRIMHRASTKQDIIVRGLKMIKRRCKGWITT